MATAAQINRLTGVNRRRTANKGKVAPGKPSGFATRDQKRRDIRTAFGLSSG